MNGRPLPRGAIVAATAVGVAVLGLAALLAWYAHDLPPLDKATDYRPRQHLQVFTADGAEIAQFGSERRRFVPIADMPPLLRQAVLAVEDTQFYEHGAISWRGLVRATLANLTGGVPQGASTITQQVARTFFLSTRRTAERKIKEALLALQLERELGKDQILELYLNQIYLGQHAYGFGAAAQVYFGRPLAALTLAETALLAGLPQNPIYANPVANLERARKRQHWVLSRMLATGVISEAQRAQAAAQPLAVRAPTFVDVHAEHVAEMARRAVVERVGERAYTDGLRVVTSLRADDQRAAHAALRRAVMAHERKQAWRGPEDHETLPDDPARAERAAALALKDQRDDEDLRVAIVLAAAPGEIQARLASGQTVTLGAAALKGVPGVQAALAPHAPSHLAIRRGSIIRLVAAERGKGGAPDSAWRVAQWPQAEGAFVALDPATGRVRALVGGFAFNRQQFNHVTQASRQAGSAFKPLLYSAAFEHGVMPETLVDDAPLTRADGSAADWSPQNADGLFGGEMSVREGLVRSRNLVSVRLLQHVGLASAREWVARFGLDMRQQPHDLTLALGSGSVTPMQLALAYALFANGGQRVAPVFIERIEDAQGRLLFAAPAPAPTDDAAPVLPPANLFLVNTLLADVTGRGTAAQAQARLQRPDLYGKTGTTNDATDAWFAGWAPGVVAVAWMGHDDPRSLGERESGGGLALPIWIDTLAVMLRGVPVQPVLPPEGVVPVGGDWRPAQWAEGGGLARLGQAAPGATAGELATGPAAGASAGVAAGGSGGASAPASMHRP